VKKAIIKSEPSRRVDKAVKRSYAKNRLLVKKKSYGLKEDKM